MKSKENWLIVLFAAAYISISLFTALIVLFLVYEIFKIVKRQLTINGELKLSLFMIITPSLISTAVYGNLKEFTGVLSQTFFNISYFAKDMFNPTERLFYKVNLTIVIFCTVEAVITVFNYYRGLEQPIWGGVFEIGIVFSLGSLSAFVMFLLEKDKLKKGVYLILFLIFTFLVFYTGKRNPILGIFFSYVVLFVVLLRFSHVGKKVLYALSGLFFVVVLAGTYVAFEKFPKYKILLEAVFTGKTLSEGELNEFSSARWEIGKKGLEVIRKDFENKNILPILIGHGYNAGARLDPPSPVGRSYESIFLISEFINIGLIGLLGLIFLMYKYFKFVLFTKLQSKDQIVALPFLVFPTYFLVGGIFSGIWDAILPLYFLMFGIAENYFKGQNR
ncbi:putative membrane protein [Sulfurihydrogenibium azorense Az-Fu1]|uniref:Putative membrane protein n=1 Tax=Sulfurihydrogenibium azorense (strain DSM 15241 / OCM 825 / Az-Fu1) TaxID=204536 RepID=C1DVV6_SULAA|nr:hypothetical protein [Sulfurihydrogenibium azorense]ACN98485.1 putative membrane protein [Sulfurihydrogenibium azorense Az-Fu1]